MKGGGGTVLDLETAHTTIEDQDLRLQNVLNARIAAPHLQLHVDHALLFHLRMIHSEEK